MITMSYNKKMERMMKQIKLMDAGSYKSKHRNENKKKGWSIENVFIQKLMR